MLSISDALTYAAAGWAPPQQAVRLLQELGNYAEYSGAPSTAETYCFAKTLLNWCVMGTSWRAHLVPGHASLPALLHQHSAAHSTTVPSVHAAQLRTRMAGGERWWSAAASPTSPQCPAPSQACACGSRQLLRGAAVKQPGGRRGVEHLCGICGAGIVKAMREQVEDIRAAKLKIFVRRGGPQVHPSRQFTAFKDQEAASSCWSCTYPVCC